MLHKLLMFLQSCNLGDLIFEIVFGILNMYESSDDETSELDIQSRTWKKLENKMKLEGFREGAAKGKYLSLQKGFNLGFSDGFKLGEYIGMCKGIKRCESKMGLLHSVESNFNENTLDRMSSEACVLCSQGKKFNPSFTEKISLTCAEDLISAQQSRNNEIIKTLEKYSEKG